MGASVGRAEVDLIDDPQWLFDLQDELQSPWAKRTVKDLNDALRSLEKHIDLEFLKCRLNDFKALLEDRDREGCQFLERRHPIGIRPSDQKNVVKGLEYYHHDFACAIHAYTLQWPEGKQSLYELVNKTASSPERGNADAEKLTACLPYIRQGRDG